MSVISPLGGAYPDGHRSRARTSTKNIHCPRPFPNSWQLCGRPNRSPEDLRPELSLTRSLHSCTQQHEKLLFARGSRRRSAEFVLCNPTITSTWCGRRASRFSGTALQGRTQKWCPSQFTRTSRCTLDLTGKLGPLRRSNYTSCCTRKTKRKGTKTRFERLQLRQVKPDATLNISGNASCPIPVPLRAC